MFSLFHYSNNNNIYFAKGQVHQKGKSPPPPPPPPPPPSSSSSSFILNQAARPIKRMDRRQRTSNPLKKKTEKRKLRYNMYFLYISWFLKV